MKEWQIDPKFVEDFYDKKARDKTATYEFQRWKDNELRKRDFDQTRNTIEYHFKNIKCFSLLEIGCGPGTWTKIIRDRSQIYIALDISSEMIELAKKSLAGLNIEYICGDFQEKSLIEGRKFDVIFSSRAFEYMEAKERASKLFFDLLHDQGSVYIITKNPFLTQRLLDRFIAKFKKRPFDTAWLHVGQISPFLFRRFLKKVGFNEIKIFPVIFDFYIPGMRFRLIRKIQLIISNYLWCLNFKKKLSLFLLPFIESYLIIGKKNI
jgi:SAM-dependent methyltransferase